MSNIGTLNERSLHASLKNLYAEPGDSFEVPLDGFVIDIVRGECLIEIQTGNFSAIKKKLSRLLQTRKLRLVYPIAAQKWIIKLAQQSGEQHSRRKSPLKGKPVDLFSELVRIPQIITNPNFTMDVVMIHEEEIRRYIGKRQRRKRGWLTTDRRLLDVLERHTFETLSDWRTFIPDSLDDGFSTQDLAVTGGTDRRTAQKIAYCLCKAGMLNRAGKKGNANLYTRAADESWF